MERKSLKPKPLFRSYPRELSVSKFVLTCHHCGVIGHIRPQCPKLEREQTHVVRSLLKRPSGLKHIVCHYCGAFGHLRPYCSKFQALKRIKRKGKLELLGSCAKKDKPDLSDNNMLLKKVFMLLIPCLCASPVLILPTLILLLMRHSFQTIFFVWMMKGSYG